LESGNRTGFYAAGAYYDMASGLGSPKAANLVPALCHEAIQVSAPRSRQSWVGRTIRLKLRARLPVGQDGPVTYRAKNLPKGLRLNSHTGLITGTITTPGLYDTVFGVSSNGAGYGGEGLVWTVAKRPGASALSLARVSTGRPLLSFRLAGGTDEARLRSITVSLPAGMFLERPLRRISVVGAAGHNVPHRLSVVGGKLVITLKQAHSPDVIRFGAGSLGDRRALLNARTRAVKLRLKVVDGAGLSSTLTETVKPTS
ncbi:MAG TPA: putative Ig domain-containing protein, partial [Solirubrobacteraceae bacterium]|nr:putative Ig domain-containing protein [Solirubrobacteraceae bacterium]